jgi:hypothetical protein
MAVVFRDLSKKGASAVVGCGSRLSSQSKKSTSISNASVLSGLHCFAKTSSFYFHIWVVLKREVLLLERDGVVEEELWSVFESIGESIPREVPMKRTCDIGEHKGNIVGQGSGKDGGQSGKCIVRADSDTRDSAIGEDQNGSDGFDVFLDLFRNTPLVELVLLKTTSVGQPRCVEDANLRKRLRLPTTFKKPDTYHYAVLARKFVKAGRVGLALVVRTTSLVGVIEHVKL